MEYSNNHRWWEVSDDQIHNEVFPKINFIQQDQSYKSHGNLRNMRLYGNYDTAGLDTYSYMRTESSYSTTNKVTLNIVQSMIDTVVSKVTKNKPKPMFLTDNGSWTLQRKAKKLNKFIEGLFFSCNFYREAAKAFQDSCIFGTGAVKIFKQDGNIKAERIFIDEIMVDDREAFYGKPRSMYQSKWVHKDVLIGKFPNKETMIEQAASDQGEYANSRPNNGKDMVLVVESWHLPSSKDSKDGKHAITVSNATLFAEEYTKNYFPFIFFRWTEKPIGFFGQGLSEQLTGLQLEINKILRTIQVSMHLVSIPKIFIEASSKIVSAHLNNKIGGVIKYAGTPPESKSLGNIPAELFSHLDRLYARAYEIAGVSQLSAQATKPQGLNSGKALREFNDIESERFLDVSRRYEEGFMEASEIMIDLAKELYEDDKNFSVKVKGKDFIQTIKWEEVDIEEDKFMMQIFPTSALSSTPAGRLQDVQELLQAGFIGREDGLKLLDFPDLQSVNNLEIAESEDIERMIEKMIDDGEYETPEPYQNLDLGIRKCQQAYLMYKAKDAPEENLELLRRWIEDADTLRKKAESELMQQQMQAEQQQQLAQQFAAQGAAGAADTVLQQGAVAPEVLSTEGDLIDGQ